MIREPGDLPVEPTRDGRGAPERRCAGWLAWRRRGEAAPQRTPFIGARRQGASGLQSCSEITKPPGAMQIYVCVTCRAEGEPPEPKEQRAGARLHAALSAQAGAAFEIVPVECLSVCKKPCTVSFAAPGKWTYVYGDLLPGLSEEIILAGARLYNAAPDGVITWKLRPDALKKGVVARIPPLPQLEKTDA